LLYADTTTTLAKLPDVATGNALISGGVGVAPSWGKIGLTTHVSGVLPVANGGTNASSASITAFNNITGYSASGATGTTTTNLVFSTSPSITTPTLVGDVTLSTGNLVIGTSGKGIDFSITSHPAGMTSELLADYEEGTFTPSLGGSTTYATQLGYYTKIGKVCYFSVNINVTSIGTGSTTAITGLPFTALYGSNNGVHAVYYDAIASSVSSLIGYVQGTTLNLVSNLIPASSVGANAIFKNSADVRVQGFYFV
jgi:hypothetical protein